ncbi:MAG: hypothetical protein ACK5RO_09375 [Pseudobdellovibrionaceae bacterium]
MMNGKPPLKMRILFWICFAVLWQSMACSGEQQMTLNPPPALPEVPPQVQTPPASPQPPTKEKEVRLKVSTRLLCNPSRGGPSSLLATLSPEDRATDPHKIISLGRDPLLQYELVNSDGETAEILIAQLGSGKAPELLRTKTSFFLSRNESRPLRSLHPIDPDLLNVLGQLGQRPKYFEFQQSSALVLSPTSKDAVWTLHDAYSDDVVDTVPADPAYMFQPIASEEFWFISFQIFSSVLNQWDALVIETTANTPVPIPRQKKKSHIIAHSWLKDGRLIWSELSEQGHQIFAASPIEIRFREQAELLADFSAPKQFTIYEVGPTVSLIYPIDPELIQVKSLGSQSSTSTLEIPAVANHAHTKPRALREMLPAPWSEEIFFGFDGRSNFLSYSMKNATWKFIGPSETHGPCYNLNLGPEYRLEKQ